MLTKRLIYFFVILHVKYYVTAQGDYKSSLTMLIDHTASMTDDIDQVLQGAKEIFDTVLNTNSSQIENFILITFNDFDMEYGIAPSPGIQVRTITKDGDEFRKILAAIRVTDPNGDCPEYSMSGIIRALEESLPASYIYVFTDATAKDYQRVGEVKSLAQQKSSQVVFVLTGDCYGSEDAPEYQVYYDTARATNGAVFNLEKQEIGQILDYVKISVEGRRTTVADPPAFPPGSHTFPINVDPHLTDPVIGIDTHDPNPSVDVTGPDGSKPPTNKFVDTKTNKVYHVNVTSPGVHTVQINSTAITDAVVTARSDINFQHGFSTFKPSSINDTTTRPVPDVESYLAIRLIQGDVELKSVRILDMSSNILDDLPLAMTNDITKFYVSTSPVVPPNTLFKIEIVAYDPKSKSYLTRTGLTPIEIQKILPGVTIPNKTPVVVIGGKDKLNLEFDNRLELICKVNAYPKPTIVWKNKDKGLTLTGKESVFEHPYDYIDILTIDNVKENATFECEASNAYGSHAQVVVVETKPKPHYFHILPSPPKGTVLEIEYEKEGQLRCFVDAYPPAEITWHKNGRKLSSNSIIELSKDNSTVTIKRASPSDRGKYVCRARNEDKDVTIFMFVTITGLEAPVIDKQVSMVYVLPGASTTIECKILRGNPKPSISWYHKQDVQVAQSIFNHLEKWEGQETIVIQNAGINDAGTYQCQADNDVSNDDHDITLVLEEPVTIAKDKPYIKAKSGSEVLISCDVKGSPAPEVTWFKDGTKLSDGDKIHISANHAIRMTVTPSDSGTYNCLASNRLGVVQRTVVVNVYSPVIITPPQNSELSVLVGSQVSLPCEATGVPEPTLYWIYNSFDNNARSRKILKPKEPNLLDIKRIQQSEAGRYTCVASNSGGTDNITYAIYVFAPPVIENKYISKRFVAVEGDRVLQISCKANGSPKPIITWTKDDLDIALGTTYDVENGTLIIRNIPRDASGIYTCEAVNVIGTNVFSDREVYEVTVLEYPTPARTTSFRAVKEGKTTKIKCDVPHNRIDQLRWYKDGKLISTGELTLENPTLRDSGHYICRVSNFFKAISENIRIEVGYEPTFVTEEETDIEMVEGPPVSLSCETSSEPKPDISWYLNGVQLIESNSELYFETGIQDPGEYRCQVENTFGSISRVFNVAPRECFIQTDKLTKLQPLMVTSNLTWPGFENFNDFMMIEKGAHFFLFCPNSFRMFPQKYVPAFCGGGMNIIIGGKKYDYTDIQCTEEITHIPKRTGERCMPGNTEKVKISFAVFGHMTIEAYEVCMNNNNNIPLYAKQTIQSSLADNDYKTTWSDRDRFRMNFDELYNCTVQTQTISGWLSKGFHRTDKCCFAKRQLVNPRDVFPGVAQRSTYSYFNVLPHWGTCNGDNWDEVEQRVRNFAKNSYGQLEVWTGGARTLTLLSQFGDFKNNFFTDRRGNLQPVPLFFWKVIQDPMSKSSLAIVQVNVPDLSPLDVYKYILCPDVCGNTDWMNNPKWQDVDRGYTYCCSLPEFEKAFGYGGVFNPDMTEILSADAGLSTPDL